MSIVLSILDLALVPPGQTASQAFAASVALAQRAEALGYRRIWYAEHHNMPLIASSAPGVLIAHVGAHTRTIRLGAGGVMLPNHAPLVIAEQFGTLASLYPGRIDLGVGRAPGTDPVTTRALRLSPGAADSFPNDVLELQAYLSDQTRVPGVYATPGKGTRVPLYVLGSSLFGAALAARLGLPYAFASHFAPGALEEAVRLYRRDFQPSLQLAAPYVIVGVNVFGAASMAEAQQQSAAVQRVRARFFLGRDADWSDEETDAVLASPAGQALRGMAMYSALGTELDVKKYLASFVALTQPDEVMTLHPAPDVDARLASIEILARAAGIEPA